MRLSQNANCCTYPHFILYYNVSSPANSTTRLWKSTHNKFNFFLNIF